MEWGELATHLGLSRAMLDFARKGQRNLSFKAIRRLEDAERDAGILPPASIISPPESRPETGSIKNITISRKGEGKGEEGDEIMAIAALLREAAERLEAYHRKQKGK
jgi:hypothetical protein